jgi:GNAT superfamily N-acetyltransferase
VDPDSAFDAPIDIPVPPGTPLLQQLIDLNGGHLSAMEDRLLRGGKVVYCVGISVLPEVQSQGVGSALLGWATQLADENDASAWIHLSDNLGGVRALERKGFKEVNRLEVDLDHYATKPRPGGGVWGSYTFRYFRREAQSQKSGT